MDSPHTAVRPPQPAPTGWFGRCRHQYVLATDLVGFVARRFATLGDIYYVPNRDGGLYVTRHPDHLREVLVTRADCYSKQHSAFKRLERILGQGLLNTDGEVWRRQRRMIQPAFQQARLHAYAPMMVEEATAMMGTWHDGQTIDFGTQMARVTLRVVSRALFSHEVGADIDIITHAVSVLQDSFTAISLLPAWWPSRQRRQARAALLALDAVMARLIAERRQHPAQGDGAADLLQRLIDARDEEGDGAGLSDKEIRDQLVTFFMAGHETTSHALTWTFYLLSQHPEVRARLQAELAQVLGGRAPRIEDVEALAYTERVVKESMRLYPPVFALARKAVADTRIGDYDVPAGSEIGLWIYQVQRDARWFDRPEAFDPDRFADAHSLQRMKHAYLPFGVGARTCIGKTFAMTEAVLLLATIAQRFDLALAPGQRVGLKPRVTLMPKYGMRMVARARAGGGAAG